MLTYVMNEIIDHAGPRAVFLHRAVQLIGRLENLHVELQAVVDAVNEIDAVAVVEPAPIGRVVEVIEDQVILAWQRTAFEDKRWIL